MPGDLGDEEMADGWTQSFIIPLPKKGNLKQCQNYCTISPFSHPSKIMLWVIFNWLKAKGWGTAGRRTSRFQTRPKHSRTDLQQSSHHKLIKKHLQHQCDLFHNLKTSPTDFYTGAKAYGMEVKTEKSKIMTHSTDNISMNGQKLEEVTSFKYLGATLCVDGTCSAKVHIRMPQQWQQWPD